MKKWPTTLLVVLVLAALAAAASDDDRPLNASLLCGGPCRCRDTKEVSCRHAAFERVPAAALVANVPAVKKL